MHVYREEIDNLDMKFTVAWAVVESALLSANSMWLPDSVLHLLEYTSNTFLR